MPALRKLTVVVILLGSALHATADLPADRTVTYLIRSSDTDPEALPALEIAMTLHAVDDDGPAVGWAISRIEFRRLNGEDPADVWLAMDAEFDTADGLWWITPDRPGSPSVEDFLMPPSLVGLATAVPTGAGLEYALVGLPGVPDPQQAPYAHAAFMGFSFRVVGEATPFLESEERPVEVPPDEEPPGGD